MKIEWWYDSSFFRYGEDDALYLARLKTRDDGTAQLLTDGGPLEFENEDEASIWLCDEEFRLLECLMEEIEEDGYAADPRICIPTASAGEELLRQMVIKLEPPVYELNKEAVILPDPDVMMHVRQPSR